MRMPTWRAGRDRPRRPHRPARVAACRGRRGGRGRGVRRRDRARGRDLEAAGASRRPAGALSRPGRRSAHRRRGRLRVAVDLGFPRRGRARRPGHPSRSAADPIGARAGSIAVDANGVWLTTGSAAAGPDETGVPRGGGRLLRIDPRTGRIAAQVPLGTYSAVLAAGGGALWLASNNERELQVTRVDPRTARTTASARTGSVGESVAVAGGAVWMLGRDGSLAQLDPSWAAPCTG